MVTSPPASPDAPSLDPPEHPATTSTEATAVMAPAIFRALLCP